MTRSSRLRQVWKIEWALPLLLLVVLWTALRTIFFEGFWGVDDLSYVNFAISPGIPADVFEARLLFNSTLILSFGLFGYGEIPAAVPSLISSLLFLAATYISGRALLGPRFGFLAAVLAAFLALDVIFSTVPLPGAAANAFCAAGTALVLTNRHRYSDLLASVLFGLSILTHLAYVFFLGPFLLALLISNPNRESLWRATRLGAVSIAVVLVLDLGLFALVAGDPLLHLHIIRSSHWAFPDVLLPLFLPSGDLNPAWFSWTIRHFLIGKGFGLMLSASIIGSLAMWNRLGPRRRFLFFVVLLGWLYLAFGTQQLFEYRPLEREERFWYPLALPACLLAASLVQLVRNPIRRLLLAGVFVLPMPLILLSSGPFGQNVEVSKELLAYAGAHPEVNFATDPRTLDEIFVLEKRALPPNVASFCGPWRYSFFFDGEPLFECVPRAPGAYQILVNTPNLNRLKVDNIQTLVGASVELTQISEAHRRPIAAVLPQSLEDSLPQLTRKPPAFVGHFVSPER